MNEEHQAGDQGARVQDSKSRWSRQLTLGDGPGLEARRGEDGGGGTRHKIDNTGEGLKRDDAATGWMIALQARNRQCEWIQRLRGRL